ncbi:hypothetical protein EDL99_11410 [Ornithobacterium rhinotracheale]|uniref:hypothetical protein n=1 Tax=Ornithobacterium rhinotracheale TaxID=28251 RepID=UPI00129D010F|nr:hypothetical protein [Ornithobacterium rhinotracheale]MRJ09453.1 hypothetical protein [Ornithobacterium rhinotracheale]UOH77228.1 hypothetical protein MT996_08400 [Ornithobacterium rhinotracheale]UOH77653.1 hypothetical protein MT996_10660 [Ornithobacterium rhinotracheale]
MEKFAILHETEEHGQILITKTIEDGKYFIRITFILSEATAEIKIEVPNEEMMNEVFNDSYDKEKAAKTVDNIKKEYNL